MTYRNLLSVLLICLTATAWSQEDVLPEYQRASGVSGTLSSSGSDTLANLMTLWTEEFKRQYPNVNIQVQAAGSSTAPPALTEGTASFGPMSRAMRDNEIEAFEARHGYPPTAIRVAIDALAVYVHKDNPPRVADHPAGGRDIFRHPAMRGGCERGPLGRPRPHRNLGQPAAPALRPQLGVRHLRLLQAGGPVRGDFKNNVNEQPGSASVVQAVSSSLNGVGYSGIGYVTSGVRSVPLAEYEGAEPVAATAENAVSGDYPLARFLYIYVNKRPGTPLPPLEREFIKLVLSRVGQDVVDKDGYVALNARMAARELRKID
jgi:phosphate transport system substrate-binding protein